METKKTYAKKLQDPRWQKKRLEIFNRDKFCCLICSSDKDTLQVHHEKYCNNPWESPNEDLMTLCFRCHEVVELCKKEKINYTNVNRLDYGDGKFVYIFNSIGIAGYNVLHICHNFLGDFQMMECTFTKKFVQTMLNTF